MENILEEKLNNNFSELKKLFWLDVNKDLSAEEKLEKLNLEISKRFDYTASYNYTTKDILVNSGMLEIEAESFMFQHMNCNGLSGEAVRELALNKLLD